MMSPSMIVIVLCARVVNCDSNLVDSIIEKEHAFEVAAGSDVYLPCDLGPTDEDPREKAIVVWYKDGTTKHGTTKDETVYSYDGRMAASAGEAARWSSTSLSGRARFEPARGSLHVRSVRVSDSARYRCQVNRSGLSLPNTFVVLSVIDIPTKLTILDSHGSVSNNRQLGPFYEGDTFDITCVVRGGNPQPWVKWWMGSRLVGENWRAVSARRTRNVYRVGPLQRQDAGAELSCRAGQRGDRPLLNASVWIQLMLSPVSVMLYSAETGASPEGDQGKEGVTGTAGGELVFRCEVEGALPPPSVRWYRDGALVNYEQNITVLEDDGRLFSTVWLQVSARDHGSNITCCSHHDRHGSAATGHYWHDQHNRTDMCSSRIISLTFPPLLEILVNDSSSTIMNITSDVLVVEEGDHVTLTCLPYANPPVKLLQWYFNNSEVIRSCVAPYEAPCSALALKVSRAHAGVYQCRAENEDGATQTEAFVLNVKYPPRCLTPGVMEFGVGPDALLNVSCNMDYFPASQPERYYWFYFNDTNHSVDTSDSHRRSLQWLPLTGQTESVLQIRIGDNFSYGTLACWVDASMKLESGDAPCVFSLRPFSRPRPPRNCRVLAPAPAVIQLLVSCDEGYDGGLPQDFHLDLVSKDTLEVISSVRSERPHFAMKLEDAPQQYSIRIYASNQLGDSTLLELDDSQPLDNVSNHSSEKTLAGVGVTLQRVCVWLAGGVCALVLVACGAALLAAHAPATHAHCGHGHGCPNADPIYECQESERGSQCSLRRTDSFRRALTPRFHKAYGVASAAGSTPDTLRLPKLDTPMSPAEAHSVYGTMQRYDFDSDFRKRSAGAGVCRVHSLRSVCGGRGWGAIGGCEGQERGEGQEGGSCVGCSAHDARLLLHLHNDFSNYSIPKPAVPLFTQTLPRRTHNRSGDLLVSSFGPGSMEQLPLPPPPATPATPREYTNVLISPLNTVGLPVPVSTNTSLY